MEFPAKRSTPMVAFHSTSMLVDSVGYFCGWLRYPASPNGWLKPYKSWEKMGWTVYWLVHDLASIHSSTASVNQIPDPAPPVFTSATKVLLPHEPLRSAQAGWPGWPGCCGATWLWVKKLLNDWEMTGNLLWMVANSCTTKRMVETLYIMGETYQLVQVSQPSTTVWSVWYFLWLRSVLSSFQLIFADENAWQIHANGQFRFSPNPCIIITILDITI